MNQAKKYYANIVWPYGMQAGKALAAVKGLDLKMIAPSHGCIWRSHIDKLTPATRIGPPTTEGKAVVVFDSMWHSTEMMAREDLRRLHRRGHLRPARRRQGDPHLRHHDRHVRRPLRRHRLAHAQLQHAPTVASFLTYMRGLSPKNDQRIGLAFGSYGWAPLGPKQVYEEMEKAKFNLPVPGSPSSGFPPRREPRRAAGHGQAGHRGRPRLTCRPAPAAARRVSHRDCFARRSGFGPAHFFWCIPFKCGFWTVSASIYFATGSQ